MKARSDLLRFTAVLLVLLFLSSSYITLAQEESDAPPAQIQLTVDRVNLNLGESTQAFLILRNTTPYTLTNVGAQLQGATFKTVNSTDFPTTLSPHISAQAAYALQSQIAGSQNIIFAVQYSWDDPDTRTTHQWLEMASVAEIEVKTPSDFNWPDYLIPLVIGLVTGQLVAFLNDWRRQRQEEHQREEQARGVTLAMLQATRKGIEAQDHVSFSLWEEAIVKGNLYPSLHRLGRKMGKPELSKRLAELSIILADYNERQAKENLTDDIQNKLVSELTALITMVENRN